MAFFFAMYFLCHVLSSSRTFVAMYFFEGLREPVVGRAQSRDPLAHPPYAPPAFQEIP